MIRGKGMKLVIRGTKAGYPFKAFINQSRPKEFKSPRDYLGEGLDFS
jgi:hypothetical protein